MALKKGKQYWYEGRIIKIVDFYYYDSCWHVFTDEQEDIVIREPDIMDWEEFVEEE